MAASNDGNSENAPYGSRLSDRYETGQESKLEKGFQVSDAKVPSERSGQSFHVDESLWSSASPIEKNHMRNLLINCGMMLFPLAYVAIAIYLKVIDGRPIAHINVAFVPFNDDTLVPLDHLISDFLKFTVTIWPIAFSVVLYRSIKTVATYKAERGSNLMILEQLIGCRSFGSAILAPLNIHTINLVCIVLVVLWAFSPIATQALQRIFYVGEKTFTSGNPHNNVTITYPDFSNYSPVFSQNFNPDSGLLYPGNAIAIAAVATPYEKQKSSPVDTWNNPKIPLLDYLEQTNTSDPWLDVPPSNKTTNQYMRWASLLGQPFAGQYEPTGPTEAAVTFVVKGHYWDIQCPKLTIITQHEVHKMIQNNSISRSWSRGFSVDNGGNYHGSQRVAGLRMWIEYRGTKKLEPTFINIASLTERGPPNLYSHARCALEQIFIRAKIHCNGFDCSVIKIRPFNETQAGHGTSGWLANWLEAITEAAGPTSLSKNISTSFERYIFKPDTAVKIVTTKGSKFVNLTQVPHEDFVERFRTILNTVWYSSYGAPYFVNGPSQALAPSFANNTDLSAEIEKLSPYFTVPVYRCKTVWLVVLLACCLVVMGVIGGSMYLDFMTLGPDILGYVGSYSHDNMYMPVPRGGSVMDGMERSRKLAGLQVRMQDVCPNDRVGHIALSSLQGSPLKKDRLYW